MRTIYLIRHGTPAFSTEERICLSRTDLPLSPSGYAQGMALGKYFRSIPVRLVYSSPLTRARETASCISSVLELREDLQELGVGCWEGLTFPEIRRQYPELYALRGEDPVKYVMPGGEPPDLCQERAMKALQTILDETTEDIAIVAHAGVNRLILSHVLGSDIHSFLKIPQPYGCINILYEDEGALKAGPIGFLPPNV